MFSRPEWRKGLGSGGASWPEHPAKRPRPGSSASEEEGHHQSPCCFQLRQINKYPRMKRLRKGRDERSANSPPESPFLWLSPAGVASSLTHNRYRSSRDLRIETWIPTISPVHQRRTSLLCSTLSCRSYSLLGPPSLACSPNLPQQS